MSQEQTPPSRSVSFTDTNARGRSDAEFALDRLLQQAIEDNQKRRRKLFSILIPILVIPAVASALLLIVSGGRAQNDLVEGARSQSAATEGRLKELGSQLGSVSQQVSAEQARARRADESLQRIAAGARADIAAAEKRQAFGLQESRNQLAQVETQLAAASNGLAEVRAAVAASRTEATDLRGRLEQLEATQRASGDPRFTGLEARIRALETKPAPIREFRYISYAVRENAETLLQDVGLRMNVGSAKDRAVVVTILSKDGATLAGPKALSLVEGEIAPLLFNDSRFDYQLVLAYFEKKWLRKDVLGVALGRRER